MQHDLLKSPILTTLVKMAIPMSWGIFSIVGFNLVDTYFLGQLGKNELAAISFTFPVVTFFSSLALGMATATSSLVSRALGEGNDQKIIRFTSDSLSFALVVVAISVTLGFLTLDPLFKALGASGQILELVKEYMLIWYSGMIFITVPMVGNGAIRAKGDTKTAAKIMVVAGITNFILDPILIFGLGAIPPLGMKGAAIATVLARALTLVASLYVIHNRYHMISFKRPTLEIAIESWKKIMHIAIPAAGSNIITPVVWSFITAIVATMGTEAVAAFGVVSRIESLAVIVIFAISASVAPMVGQNYGASNFDRIKKTIVTGYSLGMGWSILMAVILFAMGGNIMALFNTDAEIIQKGSWYFLWVPWTFGLLGIRIISCSAFNSIGRPYLSTLLIVIHMVLLYLPLISIGAHYWHMKGVFIAQAISNFLVAFIAAWLIRSKMFNRLDVLNVSK
jgi:putative MATE family efflux protein